MLVRWQAIWGFGSPRTTAFIARSIICFINNFGDLHVHEARQWVLYLWTSISPLDSDGPRVIGSEIRLFAFSPPQSTVCSPPISLRRRTKVIIRRCLLEWVIISWDHCQSNDLLKYHWFQSKVRSWSNPFRNGPNWYACSHCWIKTRHFASNQSSADVDIFTLALISCTGFILVA